MLEKTLTFSRSRSNIGLLTRFEGVEIIRAGCTGIESADRAQLNAVDPPRIVINSGEVRLLNAVDPEGQATIICTGRAGGVPIQFDKMGRVVDHGPVAGRPGRFVVAQGRLDLILSGGAPQFNPQNVCGGTGITIENVMGIPV